MIATVITQVSSEPGAAQSANRAMLRGVATRPPAVHMAVARDVYGE
jgi:hypothetical protein